MFFKLSILWKTLNYLNMHYWMKVYEKSFFGVYESSKDMTF